MRACDLALRERLPEVAPPLARLVVLARFLTPEPVPGSLGRASGVAGGLVVLGGILGDGGLAASPVV
jgi:hypothetical protein